MQQHPEAQVTFRLQQQQGQLTWAVSAYAEEEPVDAADGDFRAVLAANCRKRG